MFSIETPPVPSSPCKASALRTDDGASEQHAFLGADTVGLDEKQTPNFSIRDYVCSSRSKGITTNWPFPQPFLQLCLKHGIGDLLPPFESPVEVKTQCYRKAVEPEKEVACLVAKKISAQFESLEIKDVAPVDKERCTIEPESCFRSDELVVSCSCQAEYPLSEKAKQKAAEPHPVPSNLETLHESSEKKCRLIVKLGAFSETGRTEDIVSTSSTVSDPMASKLCPVCKIFSSSSNTTLNAHIDQCLSAESNTKCILTKIPKPKVMKPKKKRLMVDIYATALPCTLEDLDRRNGTNWVTELAFVAPTNEAYIEIKRPKLPPIDSRDDGSEGAVYVDSNGIKLRILSKFNDASPSISREHIKPKNHSKDFKEGGTLLISKNKSFASTYSKHAKLKPQIKKLSSFKLFKGEIRAASEEDCDADTHQEKEESPSEMSNARDKTKSGDSAILRHWVCSKRSDLPKKVNHKDIHYLENSVLRTGRSMVESNQPDVGNPSAVNNHILKSTISSKNLASFSKTKRVDFLANNVQVADNSKKSPKPLAFNSKWSSESTSTNGVMKISRSSGTERHSESSHPSLKVKRSSTMKKGALNGRPYFLLEGNKCDTSGQLPTRKMFRKHGSVMGTGKQGELPSDVSIQLHRSKFDPRPTAEEKTHSLHGSEALIEPTAESLFDEQAMQNCGVTCDEVAIRSVQVADEVNFGGEADIFAAHYREGQESSACLSGHGDAKLEIPRENSSVTSIKTKSDRRRNFTINREPSGSPDSSVLTISPRYRNVLEPKDSKGEPLMRLGDDLGPVVSCAASIDGTESRNIERRNQGYPAKETADSALKVSTRIHFSSPNPSRGTQALSPSNSILRLMGKNLMVMNEPQLPAHSSDSDKPSNAFSATGWESFSYHHRLPGGSAALGRASSIVNQQLSANFNDIRDGGFSFSNPTQQRPFSCFPSQSQFFSSDVSGVFRPYPSAHPRGNGGSIKRGKTLEGSDHLLSMPLEFHSPSATHLNPSLHYSQTLP